MKGNSRALACCLAVILASGALVSSAGQDPIKVFQQEMDKLVRQCTKQLEGATSIPLMHEAARDCNTAARELIDQLVAEIGPLKQAKEQVCVYNQDLDHTACFDPINIVGQIVN